MMMNDNHIPEDDLVLFALQLLPEDRMRQASRHVETCDVCRTEIAKLQGDLVAYSMMADIQSPSPEVRDRVMRQVAKEPRTAPPESEPAISAMDNRRDDRRSDRMEDRLDDRRDDRRHMPDRSVDEPFFPTRQTRDQPRPQPRDEPREQARDLTRDQSRGLQRSLPGDELEERKPHDEIRLPNRQNRGLLRNAPGDEPEERKPHDEIRLPNRQNRGLHRNVPDDEPEERKQHDPRRRSTVLPWVLAFTGWALAAGCSFVAGLQLHQRQQIQNSMAAQEAQMDDARRQAIHAQDALSTFTAVNAMQMPLHMTAAAKPATPAKPGAAPEPSTEALVAYLADKGALVFIGMHMDPAPAGKTYELWLIPADGRNPMPAGTFKPDAQGSASVVMPKLPKGVAAKGFGVTVENDGGSDTPTAPILLANS